MNRSVFDRHCAEIVVQTESFCTTISGRDMTTPVPSCPGWNVGQLARHLGGGQRWAAELVATRARERPSDDHFRDLDPFADEDAAVLTPWLLDGAHRLADALATVGPDSFAVTAPVPGDSAAFYARRFTNETLIHRADAALALGADFVAEPTVAVDAVDEWMELGSLPMHREFYPRMVELLGPGRTLHLHATDVPADVDAEWVVDLTGEWLDWRRAHEKCTVAVRGPLTELLLLVYKRRPPGAADVEILGNDGLLDFWLDRVDFG